MNIAELQAAADTVIKENDKPTCHTCCVVVEADAWRAAVALAKGFHFERSESFRVGDFIATGAAIAETEEQGFIPAWREVERLVEINAKHRKGFRLKDLTVGRILAQASVELAELQFATEEGTYPEAEEELADLLGVLFHFAIRSSFTPGLLVKAMLSKFQQRFES